MRSFHPLLLIVCLFIPALARTSQEPQTLQATAALTNKDIVMMVRAGLSQEIVIAKIKASSCSFDTAPDKLAELKKAGMTDPIILAMIEAPKDQPAIIEAPKGQEETVYVNCVNSQREVHSTAFYQSPTLAEVSCSDALIFLGSENGFAKVRTQQGVVGYMMEDFISKNKPEAYNEEAKAAHPEGADEIGYANCGGIGSVSVFLPGGGNIGKNGTVVAALKCGEKVLVLSEENGWRRIRTNDNIEGTVKAGYISTTEVPVRVSTATTPANSSISSQNTIRAIAWRAVPWVTTSYYQQPGSANTNCTGSGTWLGNIYQGNASC